MDKEFQEYYRKHEDFNRYSMAYTKRVDEIKKLYTANKKFFGKKTLDIGCGGGILGFTLETYSHMYIGIDVNADMINEAKHHARKHGSKAKFILANILKKTVTGKFDTITFIGNGLAHLTTTQLVDLLQNIDGNTRKGAYFIVDYRDVVELLFKKEWRDRLTEIRQGKTVTITTLSCDTEKGEIPQEAVAEDGQTVRSTHTIWSPFIVEALMKSHGWKLVKREHNDTWQGWLDVYKKL